MMYISDTGAATLLTPFSDPNSHSPHSEDPLPPVTKQIFSNDYSSKNALVTYPFTQALKTAHSWQHTQPGLNLPCRAHCSHSDYTVYI